MNHLRNLGSLDWMESLKSHQNLWNLSRISQEFLESHHNHRNLMIILVRTGHRIFEIIQNFSRIYPKCGILKIAQWKNEVNLPLGSARVKKQLLIKFHSENPSLWIWFFWWFDWCFWMVWEHFYNLSFYYS